MIFTRIHWSPYHRILCQFCSANKSWVLVGQVAKTWNSRVWSILYSRFNFYCQQLLEAPSGGSKNSEKGVQKFLLPLETITIYTHKFIYYFGSIHLIDLWAYFWVECSNILGRVFNYFWLRCSRRVKLR